MPTPDFYFYRRRLPHWRAAGATYFVTWRVAAGQSDLLPEERTQVVSALRHFDTSRYELNAYVVMNDHVHVIVAPREGRALEDLVRSWKSYTVYLLQRSFKRSGHVWQTESFDRVVRSDEELLEKVTYIANNPRKRWPEVADYPWVWVRGDE